jgi:cytidine deaminase
MTTYPVEQLSADERCLVEAAMAAAERAYAPYSKYRVGAAVRGAGHLLHSGCNVENASYGATICAERAAVCALVAAGEKRLSAVAVFTFSDPPALPCGVCRQVLAEFCDDADVLIVSPGTVLKRKLSALLPEAFRLRPGGQP